MKKRLDQRTHNQLQRRMQFSLGLGGLTFLLAVLIVFVPRFLPQDTTDNLHTFYFSPIEDNHFANPANWKPYYPGVFIFKDQKVIIQGEANLPFYDLQVEGQLELGIDSRIFSPEHGLIIKKQGKVNNHGEIMVASIAQNGHFNNNFTGKLDTYRLETGKHSETFNLLGAEMIVKEAFHNQGEFSNYGSIQAKENFHNSAQFHQMGSSSLLVKGQAYKGMTEVLP